MWKRCVLLLGCAACSPDSLGEVDLVLENRTSSALVAPTTNECGASHLQIVADGVAINWRCGMRVRALSAEDAAFAPVACTNGVVSIPPDGSLGLLWNGYHLDGGECRPVGGSSFEARFCFGTATRTQTGATGLPEEVVDDLRCESEPFELGIDLEVRHVVE